VDNTVPRQSGSSLQAANLALRFLLELASLAALAYWGFHTGKTLVTELLLGIGAALIAAVVWGAFAAPKSSRRLRGGALIAVQMAVFAAGGIALAAAGQVALAAGFAALVLINAVLMHAWRES
jgi:Protein of unknown function (DUF2568)